MAQPSCLTHAGVFWGVEGWGWGGEDKEESVQIKPRSIYSSAGDGSGHAGADAA